MYTHAHTHKIDNIYPKNFDAFRTFQLNQFIVDLILVVLVTAVTMKRKRRTTTTITSHLQSTKESMILKTGSILSNTRMYYLKKPIAIS
jgi:hypothetical protein